MKGGKWKRKEKGRGKEEGGKERGKEEINSNNKCFICWCNPTHSTNTFKRDPRQVRQSGWFFVGFRVGGRLTCDLILGES